MADTVRLTPEQMADKWGRHLTGAVQDIRIGVERVTESPTLKAAAKQDKMLQRLIDSVHSGKWARGLQRVSLQDWKNQVLTKGLARISSGVAGASTKMQDFARQLFEHENRGLAIINAMPDLTIEDSIARMTAWTRHMAEFQYT